MKFPLPVSAARYPYGLPVASIRQVELCQGHLLPDREGLLLPPGQNMQCLTCLNTLLAKILLVDDIVGGVSEGAYLEPAVLAVQRELDQVHGAARSQGQPLGVAHRAVRRNADKPGDKLIQYLKVFKLHTSIVWPILKQYVRNTGPSMF